MRKASAVIVPPMDSPRRRVTMFASSFWAASERRFTTPLSLIRLPSIRVPMSRVAWGARKLATRKTMMGNRTLTWCGNSDCGLSITIFLSFSVVNSLERGICSRGTRAMYE